MSVRWEIPIKYLTESSGLTDPRELFSDRFKPVTVPIKVRDEWIKLNPNSIGFYRTQYPDELLNRLVAAIQSQKLDVVERLQLQSDLFALARAGYDDTVKASDKLDRRIMQTNRTRNSVQFLKFLKSYKNESNYFVWDSISDSFGALHTLLSNTDFSDKLDLYGIELFSNLYDTISWDEQPNEPPADSLMRSLVIGNMAALSYDKVVAEAKRRFNEHNNGGRQIPANLRSAIYRAVAQSSNDEEFEVFFQMYRNADSSAERQRIGSAMGATRKPDQISKVLNFSLSGDVR